MPLYSTRYYWIKGEYNRVWKKYMTAGTNFPFLKIFPAILDHRFAIDGGGVDNIPLYPLLRFAGDDRHETPDLIFVLHFDGRYDYRKTFKTEIPIIDLDLSISNDFDKDHFDYSKTCITERISAAYEYGKKIMARVMANDITKENLKRVADEIFMEEHEQRQQHPSVDMYIGYLNVIARALRSETRCMNILF